MARIVLKSDSADTNTVFLLGQSKHLMVGGGLHAEVSYVNGIVPGGSQTGSNARRDRVVHEELQEAAPSGISRSRTLSAA